MDAPPKPARQMTKSMSTSILGMKSLKKKKLPDNFADQVLDLELECEKSWVAVEHVNRLVELYSDAVEYYESIKDKKYVIFKNKIQQLFTRPQVMDALSRGSTGGNPGINEEEEKALEDRRARQRELEMNLYLLQKTASDKDAKSILSNHEKAWQDKEAMIKADLKGQEATLKNRIEARRKRILEAQQAAKNPQDLNSGPHPGLLPMNEINGVRTDESDLKQIELKSPASPDNPAKREEKFKKLLDVEELEMERDKKLKEIEKKYDPQISNLESKLEISGNNIIVTKLIAKLRSERENALKKVNDEYAERTKSLNPLP